MIVIFYAICVLCLSGSETLSVGGDETLCSRQFVDLNLGCTCPDRITEDLVNCSSLQITKIPDDLDVASHVRVLLFTNNLLTKISPSMFDEVSRIETLSLKRNLIHSMKPKSFSSFDNLKELDLSMNLLRVIESGVFDDLEDLEVLNLSNNNFKTLDNSIFQQLPSLKQLILRSINLLNIILQDQTTDLFTNLTTLETLDLTNCSLTYLPSFDNTLNIKELKLNMNPLKSIPTLPLSLTGSLELFDISGTLAPTLSNHGFHGLHNLKALLANKMPNLQFVDSFAFADLDSLEILEMKNNPNLISIDTLAFRHLDGEEFNQKKLQKVYLSQNALRFLHPRLLPWDNLKVINMDKNPWNCDCRMRWVVTDVNDTDIFGQMVICSSPEYLSGLQLSKLPAKAFICTDVHEVSKAVLSSFLAVAMVLGILLVVCIAFRAYRCSCPNTWLRKGSTSSMRSSRRPSTEYSRIESNHKDGGVMFVWEDKDGSKNSIA